jgi:uncharacterized protein (TIGR03435 family)
MSLYNIVWIAFNLRSQQLVAPDWMNEPRFDITAKIPEGATREQFYLMFQNTLAERFGLKVHHDQKEVQGYELTVTKNGPKFKESGPEPPKDAVPPVPQPPSLGPDGFPLAIPGISGVSITRNRARGQWLRAKMERLFFPRGGPGGFRPNASSRVQVGRLCSISSVGYISLSRPLLPKPSRQPDSQLCTVRYIF